MASWMGQYSDLPMDLADASLLWLAHEHGLRRIAANEEDARPRVSCISSSHLTPGHGNIWIINCAHWGE
jgi:hypothetical protein